MTMANTLKPALFLDRDGVIIHDAGYLKQADQVRLIPTAAELIRRANEAGVAVVVVTNQSGIGRTWITLEDYKSVSARMVELLALKGAGLDRIYFAPFYKTAESSPYPQGEFEFVTGSIPQKGAWTDEYRKPNAGMLKTAAQDLGLDLSRSIMIGDRVTDLAAAHNAGLPRFYFLKSDLFENETQDLPAWLEKLERHRAGSFHFETVDTLGEIPLPGAGGV